MAVEQKKPLTAADWQPFFERALKQFVAEQRGGVTEINARNLLKFIMRADGYPEIETENEARRVGQLLNRFFSHYFGPLWDGVKYRQDPSKGRSLLVGTDNLLDLIKYKMVVK